MHTKNVSQMEYKISYTNIITINTAKSNETHYFLLTCLDDRIFSLVNRFKRYVGRFAFRSAHSIRHLRNARLDGAVRERLIALSRNCLRHGTRV